LSQCLSHSRESIFPDCCSQSFFVFLNFCLFLVSLPSASQAEAQTILEKQNLIKAVKVVDDKIVVVDKPLEVEEVEIESESDNEEVDDKNVNLDNEFDKVVPIKFKRLSEESLEDDDEDEVDHEIAEILNEAKPLGADIKSEVEASGADITTEVESLVTEIKSDVVTLARELKADAAGTLETHFKSINPVTEQIDTESADKSEPKDIKAAPIDEAQSLPNESEEDKPPVPIQTYLWEDLKRSKEQVSGDNVCTIHLFRHLQTTTLPKSLCQPR
jgi:hypothetical protein